VSTEDFVTVMLTRMTSEMLLYRMLNRILKDSHGSSVSIVIRLQAG
jgi:hypothetical protein